MPPSSEQQQGVWDFADLAQIGVALGVAVGAAAWGLLVDWVIGRLPWNR